MRLLHADARSLPLADESVQVVVIKGGDMSEWPEDLRVREFPATWEALPKRAKA